MLPYICLILLESFQIFNNINISAPNVPENISITASKNTMTVSWTKLKPLTFTGPTQYVVTATDTKDSMKVFQCKTQLSNRTGTMLEYKQYYSCSFMLTIT